MGTSRATKLERLDIPPSSRVIKDWFPTRESADMAIQGILAHIKATGETYTCVCHTHTRPPDDAVPVYISEFVLPQRFIKNKRFCPCPCCWDEFPKFGRGKIAWFPAEKVIRLIGPDCFATLNPEAHSKAQADFDREQAIKRDTDFLLSNLPHLPRVIATVHRGIVVAKAIEAFHADLHAKLASSRLNLWTYVRRGGELSIYVKEQEFRRGSDGSMRTEDVDTARVAGVLPGYRMLDPGLGSVTKPLETALNRLLPFNFGEEWKVKFDHLSDDDKNSDAKVISRSVSNVRREIAEIEELRRFTHPVAINTLRTWGLHEGCPIPRNYQHDGGRFLFGRSEYDNVAVVIPPEINNHIGEFDFWTPIERKGR